jgi:hypothetical protein
MEGSDTVVNYDLLAWGISDVWGTMSTHPGTELSGTFVLTDEDSIDKDGDGETDDDWDIYVFIAGKYWNTVYYDADHDGVAESSAYVHLPAGEYRCSLYVELYTE